MIQIDDLQLRKFDALNWTIERKHTTYDGEYWTTIGYYPSLENATRNLCITAISDQESFAGLIRVTEEIKIAMIKAVYGR